MKYLVLALGLTFAITYGEKPVEAQPSLPVPPSQAPIDGGLGLLAAAGGAYAYKKLRDRKLKEEEDTDL